VADLISRAAAEVAAAMTKSATRTKALPGMAYTLALRGRLADDTALIRNTFLLPWLDLRCASGHSGTLPRAGHQALH
jgi:hypothetical protein